MKPLLLMLAILTLALPTLSEEIKIPVGQQGRDRTIALPHNGVSADAVLAQFGEPQQRTEAVGKPPISSWRYAEFTVYFEHNRVLHAVLNPPAPPAQQ